MRIITYSESEWDEKKQRYVTTYSEGYEYSGKISWCGGGSAPAPVPPSAEEKALQASQAEQLNLQTQILQEQQASNKLLQPLILKDLGFKNVEFDDKGNVVSLGERTEDQFEDIREEIEGSLLDKSLAALKGELPDNPALLADLRTQEQELNERLRRQLGPGFETSTPGIQSLQEFQGFKTGVIEGSRRGDLTLAEGLSLARENQLQASQQQLFSNLIGQSNINTGTAGGFGQVAAGFGQAQQPFQFNRAQQDQANLAAFQQPNAFGQIFGAVAGGLAGNPGIFKCWVAQEVYGGNNPQWVVFWGWKEIDSPKWFKKLYDKYGERVAEFISGKPRVKAVIRYLMDKITNG